MPVKAETVETFLKLAEFREGRRNARRQFEFRYTLAMWGALVAIGYKVPEQSWQLGFITICAVLVYCVWFVVPVWRANKLDAETAFYYLERAEREMDPLTPVRPKPVEVTGKAVWVGALKDWGCKFQVITTAIVAIGVWLLAGKLISN